MLEQTITRNRKELWGVLRSRPDTVYKKDYPVIKVKLDGSWTKQGFNVEFGVAVILSSLTNKVVDFEFISSFCNKRNMRKAKAHKKRTADDDEDEEAPDCTGEQWGMESFGAKAMFGRSLQWPTREVMFGQVVRDRVSGCMFHIRNSYNELGLCDVSTRWNGVASDNKD